MKSNQNTHTRKLSQLNTQTHKIMQVWVTQSPTHRFWYISALGTDLQVHSSEDNPLYCLTMARCDEWRYITRIQTTYQTSIYIYIYIHIYRYIHMKLVESCMYAQCTSPKIRRLLCVTFVHQGERRCMHQHVQISVKGLPAHHSCYTLC